MHDQHFENPLKKKKKSSLSPTKKKRGISGKKQDKWFWNHESHLNIHESMWITGYSDSFCKNLNHQRSLTPSWPVTPHLLRSHVWLYPRIIVSKSHENTLKYVDTVTLFAKTWTKGQWPLDDLWPDICWGLMCDSTQGSLFPSPMKIHQSMWIQWPFLPKKTWTKGHWPLNDLWPHICWGHMCDFTQGSLCPSPMKIHQSMWIQWTFSLKLEPKVIDPQMTSDPKSDEVTCVTLPKDHCFQVPWEYMNVCGYSDQFCKNYHIHIHTHTTYYIHIHTTYRISDHIVSFWTTFRRDKKVKERGEKVVSIFHDVKIYPHLM